MGYTAQDIARIRLFYGLDSQQRLELFEISQRHKLDPNTVIVKEGEIGSSLFVILSGSVRVTKGIKGELEHLATLACGDFFGEMALLEESTRSATVTTMEATTLLEFKMDKLANLFHREPRIGQRVYQNLAKGISERLRSFAERVKEISWREE